MRILSPRLKNDHLLFSRKIYKLRESFLEVFRVLSLNLLKIYDYRLLKNSENFPLFYLKFLVFNLHFYDTLIFYFSDNIVHDVHLNHVFIGFENIFYLDFKISIVLYFCFSNNFENLFYVLKNRDYIVYFYHISFKYLNGIFWNLFNYKTIYYVPNVQVVLVVNSTQNYLPYSIIWIYIYREKITRLCVKIFTSLFFHRYIIYNEGKNLTSVHSENHIYHVHFRAIIGTVLFYEIHTVSNYILN